MSLLGNFLNAIGKQAPSKAQSRTTNAGGLAVQSFSVGGVNPGEPLERTVIKREKPPEKRFAEFGRPLIPESVIRKVASRNGGLLTSEEIAAIRKLSEEHQRVMGQLNEFTRRHAGKAFKQQSTQLADKLRAGETIADENIYENDELDLEYSRKRQACQIALRGIGQQAIPYQMNAADRLAANAAQWADEIETTERARFEEFGVKFHPSLILVLIGQLEWRASDMLPTGNKQDPAHLLKLCGVN